MGAAWDARFCLSILLPSAPPEQVQVIVQAAGLQAVRGALCPRRCCRRCSTGSRGGGQYCCCGARCLQGLLCGCLMQRLAVEQLCRHKLPRQQPAKSVRLRRQRRRRRQGGGWWCSCGVGSEAAAAAGTKQDKRLLVERMHADDRVKHAAAPSSPAQHTWERWKEGGRRGGRPPSIASSVPPMTTAARLARAIALPLQPVPLSPGLQGLAHKPDSGRSAAGCCRSRPPGS